MGMRCLVAALLLLLGSGANGSGETPPDNSTFIEGALGYHVGMLAYIYGYPIVDISPEASCSSRNAYLLVHAQS